VSYSAQIPSAHSNTLKGREQELIRRRKTILPVIFTYAPGSTPAPGLSDTKSPKPICPSCSRDLSNSNHSILLSSKSPLTATNGDADEDDRPKKKTKKEKSKEEYVCGHVVCKTCADSIVKESGRCCVCEAGISADGMIPLGKEGTGFAAAGGSEVKRNVTTFRV
jgi:nitric oxide synthase-interacting protein